SLCRSASSACRWAVTSTRQPSRRAGRADSSRTAWSRSRTHRADPPGPATRESCSAPRPAPGGSRPAGGPSPAAGGGGDVAGHPGPPEGVVEGVGGLAGEARQERRDVAELPADEDVGPGCSLGAPEGGGGAGEDLAQLGLDAAGLGEGGAAVAVVAGDDQPQRV